MKENTLTQEDKRIKLAEAGGWKRKSVDLEYPLSRPEGRWEKGELTVFHFGQLPDYFNDLNAVHELEKVLTKPQQNKFILELDVIIRGDGDYFDIAHATAAQRAEVIGLTLGLWEARNDLAHGAGASKSHGRKSDSSGANTQEGGTTTPPERRPSASHGGREKSTADSRS